MLCYPNELNSYRLTMKTHWAKLWRYFIICSFSIHAIIIFQLNQLQFQQLFSWVINTMLYDKSCFTIYIYIYIYTDASTNVWCYFFKIIYFNYDCLYYMWYHVQISSTYKTTVLQKVALNTIQSWRCWF